MPGKLDVYNLGENGVDVVKSPLHQADGDLIQAQNAMPDPAGLEGGIRKRGGMAKVNAIALTGSIGGAVHVPLPAPGTRTYYLGQHQMGGVDPADTWYSSVGGSTGWAGRSTPSLPQMVRFFAVALARQCRMTPAIGYKRRLFYAAHIIVGNEDPVLRVWDGSSDNELCRFPRPKGSASERQYVGHLWVHRGFLYATCDGDVFKINIVTGEIVLLGDEFTVGFSEFGLSFLDRIWVGQSMTGAMTSGRISWIRNGESTWTTERDGPAAAHQAYCHGAVYLGDLFVGTFTDAGTAAIVERRSTGSATWATSLTGPDTSVNYFSCFAVFDGNLYCVYRSSTSMLVKKYDGTSWTTDLDVLVAGHAHAFPCGILAETDALYIYFAQPTAADSEGYVLRRTTAGAWSKPEEPENANGMIAFLP